MHHRRQWRYTTTLEEEQENGLHIHHHHAVVDVDSSKLDVSYDEKSKHNHTFRKRRRKARKTTTGPFECCCNGRTTSQVPPVVSNDYSSSSKQTRRQRRIRCAIVGCIVVCLFGSYMYFMLGARIPVNQHPAHPPIKNIPYPPTNISISVVLMNYARPRMIKSSSLLITLLHHPNINEILLCHANNVTKFDFHHEKVINIDAIQANTDWGLALRFYYCSTRATNRWILHVDDDIELDDSAINELLWHMIQNPHRIVGHYARQYNYWKVPHRHGYDFATTLFGNVEVVLTKLLILEQEICTQFIQLSPIVNDIVATSIPHWNGEDIFVNMVANHYYNVSYPHGPYNNYAIPALSVWEADNAYKDDDTGAHDLSANMDRHYHVFESVDGFVEYWSAWWRSLQHYYYRGKLWSLAKHRLAALPPPPSSKASLS